MTQNQTIMIQGDYAYKVDYYKKDKPNEKRSILVYANDYEVQKTVKVYH